MKHIIAITLSLFLTGCFWQTIDETDIKRGEKYCQTQGGLWKVSSHWIGVVNYKCKDGE